MSAKIQDFAESNSVSVQCKPTFAQGKPGLPRNAKFAKIKCLIIRRLKISKSLLRGTPGLPESDRL